MLLLHAALIASTAIAGQALPQSHNSARPLIYAQSTPDEEGFICATLCPGTFCPGSCVKPGQEPDKGNSRTLQSTGSTDGPVGEDAARRPKQKSDGDK